MNENPGGTLNPLNPAPTDANPAPAATPAEPVAAQPVATQPVATAEPEPKGSVVEPKNKSKKGLVITIILLLVALIGGAVAAILILNPFGNKDAVPTAIQKLFNGDYPTKISMDGTIVATSSESDFPFSAIKLTLKSGADTKSMDNYADIDFAANLADGSDFSFEAHEIYTNESLYLKLSGVADVLNQFSGYDDYDDFDDYDDYDYDDFDIDFDYDYDDFDIDFDYDYDDDYDYGYSGGSSLSGLSIFSGLFETIDGKWIHIPGSSFSDIAGTMTTDKNAQCLIETMNKIDSYGSTFAKLYKDNPFVNYTTDNLKIAQKKNQLYLLSFDANKLTNFLNAMVASDFVNDIADCAGGVTTSKVDTEQVAEIVKEIPALYVEIDNNYNFTRVYLDISPNDSLAVTADISLDYPSSITVEEPAEYTDISELFGNMFSSSFGRSMPDQSDSLFTF